MPVIASPTRPPRQRLGMDAETLLEHMAGMHERGLLRRVAAILFHRRAGFSANGMGVWKVPAGADHRSSGPRMASFRGISHCYQRPTYEDWPYSVFTMAHGRSKEECDAILDAIAEQTGIEERATLYSSTEFKKIRLLYFTDEYRGGKRSTPERGPTRPCDAVAHRHPLRGALPARAAGAPRRRQLAGARDALRSAATRSSSSAATGAELVDVDGNRYVDYVCSWGPLIPGHAHPRVLEAVSRRRERGTSFGAPTAGEVELAEEIARRMPGVEMLRMTSSGTEATMTALRLARAATGRERIVKFAGAYHGHVGRPARAGRLGPRDAGDPREPGGARRARRPRRWSCPGTTPRRWSRRSAARAGGDHRRAAPGEHGPRAAARGLPRAAARARRRERRAADPRRGHQRLSRRARAARRSSRACTATSSSWARSSAAGCPPAAVGGRARADGAARAGRRGLPGGHAVGQPARGGRGARDARAARRAPTRAGGDHRAARGGPARGGERGAGASSRWRACPAC